VTQAAASSTSTLGAGGPAALSVRGLNISVINGAQRYPVVRDMAFDLAPGQTLCIVGESGCGKSMTALALLQLLPLGVGTDSGAIRLGEIDLCSAEQRSLEDARGKKIAMVFQEPLSSLNPVMTIGEQIAEVLVRHEAVGTREAGQRAVEMLARVKLPDPQQRARQFAHQLSGGMRQRAMIALALACDPKVLVADEPTTALDVTIQAEILALIGRLQQSLGTALVLITHDFGVVAEMADQVIVMYAGRRVECADVETLFDRPLHPYTIALMHAAPGLQADVASKARLMEIAGMVPPPWALPRGCAFAPRCASAFARCLEEEPVLSEAQPGHHVACWAVGAAHG
jgi:peptide/nickel transport system ATP-binding protein